MKAQRRCKWCNLKNPLYVTYHDMEWGVPNFEDHYLYEMLILESFQAGLSWECVLNKREAFRQAYDQFDIEKVIIYDEEKMAELAENKGIIRNKRKIRASVQNSRIFKDIVAEFGSFYDYLKTFTGGEIFYEIGKTTNALSDAISADLQKRGMTFVGSVIIYSYLQAIGVIWSHDEDCFMHKIRLWKEEEKIAHVHGWDFSHIAHRSAEQTDFPWDYRQAILDRLTPDMKLLDVDTGGGEFLLSLGHPHENTAASEGYAPNADLCRQTLTPLGIDFRPGSVLEGLPFEDASFDMIINRHGDMNAAEFWRLLKPGGLFITQHVGAENDRELVKLLCGNIPLPFPEQYLHIAEEKLRQAGFQILEGQECHRPYDFFDVGALVWFARIIQWEFPDFSVDTHLDRLFDAQKIIDTQGLIHATTHRYFVIAQKPTNKENRYG